MKKTVLGLLLILSLFLNGCFTRITATAEGTVIIEIADGTSTLETQSLPFFEGDSLLSLLRDHFTVYCADAEGNPDESCSYVGAYGIYLVGIETILADQSGEYVAFYIDGEYAMTGVDATPLEDGKTYRFVLESYVPS